MRVQIINKAGQAWDFSSVKAALPYIKKDRRKNYTIVDNVRVYDDRDEAYVGYTK